MRANQLRYAAKAAGYNARAGAKSHAPKTGEEIFAGTDYPQSWEEFIGQEKAVVQLRAAIEVAKIMGQRLDHTLLATGLHGVGKTSMAKLIAYTLGTGLVELSGKISVEEIRPVLKGMADGDVLFIDEIHQLVAGGTTKAEWLLHLLQDGVLMTARGPEPMPKVTVLAATTDVQKLPETILSRFMNRPTLEAYTDEEAAKIAEGMAIKLGFNDVLLRTPSKETLAGVAYASNNAPRDIKALLTALRNAALTGHSMITEDATYDLTMALQWAGVTYDGLPRLAQDYLCVLLTMFEGTAGEETIRRALGEPKPVPHTEKLLTQRGFLATKKTGRELTEAGVARAVALLTERGLLEEGEAA